MESQLAWSTQVLKLPQVTAARVRRLLAAARASLDRQEPEEAVAQCQQALAGRHLSASDQAWASVLLAEALEYLARDLDAVKMLARYESPAARASFTPILRAHLLLRLGAAYGRLANIPKALSYARQALQEAIREGSE